MREGLREEDLAGAVEAMLFIADAPTSTITMADMLEVDPLRVQDACVELRERLAADERGVQLEEVSGGWRLVTHPRYHELLERYVLSWDTRKLSQAAIEVLAIVAYAQPVTRQAIANVRGVNSDSSLNSLLEKGLVREVGNEDAPGNAALYGTSKVFLEKFGLRGTDDLPDLDRFAPDDKTRELIRTRLSATRGFIPAVRDDDEPAVLDGEEVTAEGLDETMRDAMGEALMAAAGAVEKIDFDDLEFDL